MWLQSLWKGSSFFFFFLAKRAAYVGKLEERKGLWEWCMD